MRVTRYGIELIVVVCLFGVLCRGQAVQRSSFGEHCNDTVKCDKSDWLKCESSLCACLMDDMIFDQPKDKCVSKPGERCKYLISDNGGMVLYESTDCVVNSHCNNAFICACDQGHFENVDGKCVEQRDIDGSCTSSAECKESKFLFCIDGQCRCSAEHNHMYANPTTDNSTSMCVTKAGNSNSGGTPCVEGSNLQDGVCTCNNLNYTYAAADGFCHKKKDVGEACTADEECQFVNKYFTCIDGICRCNPQTSLFQTFQKPKSVMGYESVEVLHPNERNAGTDGFGNQLYYRNRDDYATLQGEFLGSAGRLCRRRCAEYVYINASITRNVNETLSQCVGLARLPCNPESNCVKDSTCVEGTCVCARNFSPSSTGTCGIGHGESCSKSTPCSDFFKCTNNFCKCPQAKHQVYNYMGKCIGRVSSFCDDNSDCFTNAVCQMAEETGRKQCACAEGFVEDSLGNCDKAWNSTCDKLDTIACDTVAQLECRNGFCACSDTLTSYDMNQRKCLGVVGARCSSTPKTVDMAKLVTECSEGAHCVKKNSNAWVAGRCLCKNEFEVKEDMLCHKLKSKVQSPNYTSTLAPNTESTEDVWTGFKLVPEAVETDPASSTEVDTEDD